MPLTADVSEEDVIVSIVDIDIVIECDELISGNTVIIDYEERKEVLLDLLSWHSSSLEVFNYTWIEVLH